MKKKKQKEQEQVQLQQEPVAEKQQDAINTTAFPLSDMSPSDELQIYYNDAYLREKQRFNDIFGIIEHEEEKPKEEAPSVDLSEYVPIAEYKKVKKKLRGYRIAFWVTFVAFIALLIVFLIKAGIIG